MMKVLLVTGGAGFIGSNFVKYFLRRNKNFIVINMDKLTHSSSINNLREVENSPRHQFIKGDICNSDFTSFVLRKYNPEYIINFASESHMDKNITAPHIFGESNIMGTLSLLEGARDLWHRSNFVGKRFIQVSTDEVYGSLLNRNDVFLEESPMAPNNPYSASKASADMLARSFYFAYGLPIIIARCCNNYGPSQHKDRFIPTCIINALEDKPIPIYGDGTNIREWIHVTDNTIALIRALFYGKPGEIYNIGSGQEISNIDLAKSILRIVKKPESLLKYVKDKPGHDYRYSMNSYKIRNNLGWSNKVSLDEGLTETVKWCIGNSCKEYDKEFSY